jgi:hypothetical protein
LQGPRLARQLEDLVPGTAFAVRKKRVPQEGDRRSRGHAFCSGFGSVQELLDWCAPAGACCDCTCRYGDTESFLDHFHFTKKRGVEYRQVITLDDRKLALTLYGPVVKKKPGLGFRLTGTVGNHNFVLKGYGNVKRQVFKIQVDF